MSVVALGLPSVERRPGSPAAAAAAGEPLASVNQTMYCLEVRQQPRQARLAGSGEKADRRTVDPPPIIRLRVRRPGSSAGHGRRKMTTTTAADDDFVSPTLTHTHFCFASLVPEHSDDELYELAGTRSKYVGGSVVASLFHLKDQSCFVFPDLSVRTEGRWRFKMSLFQIVEHGVIFCDSVLTDVFQVYSSKRFPGMRQSTELSKSLAQQGLKLRIRRPEPQRSDADDVEVLQPRRKKAKPTPRQRPVTSSGAWPVATPVESSHHPPALGPEKYSHCVPFVAPIGSTTSTPQQRPWTSWNASSPSLKFDVREYHNRLAQPEFGERLRHHPDSGTDSARNYDGRLPRMLDSRSSPALHASFSTRPDMPPPSALSPTQRQSPPSRSPLVLPSLFEPLPTHHHNRDAAAPSPSSTTTLDSSRLGLPVARTDRTQTPSQPSSPVPPPPPPPPGPTVQLAPIRAHRSSLGGVLPYSIDRTPSLHWSDPFSTSSSFSPGRAPAPLSTPSSLGLPSTLSSLSSSSSSSSIKRPSPHEAERVFEKSKPLLPPLQVERGERPPDEVLAQQGTGAETQDERRRAADEGGGEGGKGSERDGKESDALGKTRKPCDDPKQFGKTTSPSSSLSSRLTPSGPGVETTTPDDDDGNDDAIINNGLVVVTTANESGKKTTTTTKTMTIMSGPSGSSSSLARLLGDPSAPDSKLSRFDEISFF